MFNSSHKPINFQYGKTSIPTDKPFEIKKKKEVSFELLTKKNDDKKWNVKAKDMDKPNPRLRAKMDLVNNYYTEEKISSDQLEKFKKHLHKHTKKHIKRMLVEIHRRKKSFSQAHITAEKMDEEIKNKLNNKK
tara:strand:+ start:230 stop:628 length:399 start_codon:yes stop_codon:yes gene_type:complete